MQNLCLQQIFLLLLHNTNTCTAENACNMHLTLWWCFDSQQVKSNQPLDVRPFSSVGLMSHNNRLHERESVRKSVAVISMQQTERCISAILMWWSRPGHRQTALSSSSLLCTHQGLCRDLQPTTLVL